MSHDHCCDHIFSFCKCCDTVYCKKCKKEWRASNNWGWYPNYYYYSAPVVSPSWTSWTITSSSCTPAESATKCTHNS
jgi:hypothetical protein